MLIVRGEKDESVSYAAAIRMVNSLRKSGRTNINLALYGNMGHDFRTAAGSSLAADVVHDINAWLLYRLQDATDHLHTSTSLN